MFTFIHKQKISSLSKKKKSYENLFISLLMQQLSHWLLCQFKKKKKFVINLIVILVFIFSCEDELQTH